MTPHKLNTEKTVAVSTEYFWNEDLKSAPIGVKVQALTMGGVAVYTRLTGKENDLLAWVPLPRRKPK